MESLDKVLERASKESEMVFSLYERIPSLELILQLITEDSMMRQPYEHCVEQLDRFVSELILNLFNMISEIDTGSSELICEFSAIQN